MMNEHGTEPVSAPQEDDSSADHDALRSLIYGEPLATEQYDVNRLRKVLALPVFCSDARG